MNPINTSTQLIIVNINIRLNMRGLTLTKDDKKVNAAIMIVGIIVYSFGLLGVFLPNNIISRVGILDPLIIFPMTYMIAVFASGFHITRFKKNKKSITYLIGLVLNITYALAIIAIIILFIVVFFSGGAGAGV